MNSLIRERLPVFVEFVRLNPGLPSGHPAITRAFDAYQNLTEARRPMADAYVPAELEVTIVVLRKKVADAEAERDRLRAVVEDAVVALSATDYDDWTRVLGAMREALDGSEDMGGHDHVVDRNAVEAAGRCPDCGNPDRYCDCPDRREDMER